ncbi:MAG: CARDB domain-containing protein, partial [Planctomycetota bacterium]
ITESRQLGDMTYSPIRRDGWISELTDVDLYAVDAVAGQTLSMVVLSTSDLKPYLRFFGPLGIGNHYAPEQLGQAVAGVEVHFPVVNSGRYYIGISEAFNKTYSISSGTGDIFDPRNAIGSYSLILGDTSPTADLRGNSFDVLNTPVEPGKPFDVKFTVANLGDKRADNVLVDLYASSNDYISNSDTKLGSITIASIGAGQESNHTVSLTLPADYNVTAANRQFTIGMLIDPDGAIKEKSELNNSNRGSQLDLKTVVFVKLPGQSTVTGPGTTTNKRPVFSWTAASHAETYELVVHNLTTGAVKVINQTGLQGTTFQPTNALSPASYRVLVRPWNQDGAGSWSDSYDFVLDAGIPQLLGPSGNASSRRPEFSWTAVENAAGYDLWVDQLGVKSQVIRQPSLDATKFTPGTDLSAGNYRFWARVNWADGTKSPWSPSMDMTIPQVVPQLTGPGPGSRVTRGGVQFTWTAVPDATRYELWVDLKGGQSKIITQNALQSTSYIPTENMPVGSYTCWVRAQGANNVWGKWSASLNFHVIPEQVTWPATWRTIEANAVTLNWNAVSGASVYEVWIDNRTTGQSKVIWNNQVTTASLKILRTNLPAATYRIWIRAIGVNNLSGAWSAFKDLIIV